MLTPNCASKAARRAGRAHLGHLTATGAHRRCRGGAGDGAGSEAGLFHGDGTRQPPVGYVYTIRLDEFTFCRIAWLRTFPLN